MFRDSEKNFLINAGAGLILLGGGLLSARVILRASTQPRNAPPKVEALRREITVASAVPMPTIPASELAQLRRSMIQEPTPVIITGTDPITTNLLNCSKTNMTASSDSVEGGIKRQEPHQGSTEAGRIYAGTEIKINDVVRKKHIEGRYDYWTLVLDQLPEGNVSDQLISSFALTVRSNSGREGALVTNGDFNNCEIVYQDQVDQAK